MWQSIPDLGTGLLLASLVGAGYSFAIAAISASGRLHLLAAARRASYGTVALVATAVIVLAYAFVTHDFRISYVARYSDRSMSVGYLMSALWGGQDGSLLWWMFLLAMYSAACIRWLKGRYVALQPYVLAALMSVIVFFGLITLFGADPFTTTLTGTQLDGRGLNPLLQNIYMIIHPPALYLGFVGCTIPFAFAVAALISGRLDNEWIVAVRKWMLFAWLFLSIGNALGMIWAYVELGWGGYWGWDPVENAALLPWLTATAYVHSTVIQERRRMFKLWNVSLICLTFLLTIFGTFLTRSGVIASVHAFAKSNLGTYFLVYLGLLIAVVVGLIVWRFPKLRSEAQIEYFASRETAFVSNNWALMGATVFVAIATTFPMISEAFLDKTASVSPEFYNRWMTPIGLIIFALMGLGTLFGWRKTSAQAFRRAFVLPTTIATAVAVLHLAFGDWLDMPAIVWGEPILGGQLGRVFQPLGAVVPLITTFLAAFNVCVVLQEFWRGMANRRRKTGENPVVALLQSVGRSRRRYGGYIVHFGITLMFVGFLGRTWGQSGQASLAPGQTFDLQNYSLTYEGLRIEVDANREMHFADFVVTDRWGNHKGRISPAKFFYRTHQEQPTSEVAVLNTIRDDVYVVVGNLSQSSGRVAIQVHINPLVSWIWAGVIVLVLGASLSLWPSPSSKPSVRKLPRKSPVHPSPVGTQPHGP